MKKLMATMIFLSFGSSVFAAQFKTVTENVGHGSYTATVSYPQLFSNSIPASKSINEQVRNYIVENGCDIEGLMDPNMDYQANAKIVALNKNYVGYEVAVDSYCGGAHPNSDTYNMTFDSKTGAPVEMENEVPIQATEMTAEYQEYQRTLATLMYNNYNFDMSEKDEECYDGTKEEILEVLLNYSPLVSGLAADKKVVLRIYPPHAATVCAFSVRVNYNDIKKYVDPNGSLQKWLK
jgi:hypothetical protein